MAPAAKNPSAGWETQARSSASVLAWSWSVSGEAAIRAKPTGMTRCICVLSQKTFLPVVAWIIFQAALPAPERVLATAPAVKTGFFRRLPTM